MILFFFCERDIALIIKYEFHDETRSVQELNSQEFKNKNHENDENQDDQTAQPSQPKKLKLLGGMDRKRQNIIDYSSIKLPALGFAEYLIHDSSDFIDDCLR